jgi:hypothetical protein
MVEELEQVQTFVVAWVPVGIVDMVALMVHQLLPMNVTCPLVEHHRLK